MKSLRILEIPGFVFPNREVPEGSFFEVLKDLSLNRLNLDRCENLVDFHLERLLAGSTTAARSLKVLHISHNLRLTSRTARLISESCSNIEELIWVTDGIDYFNRPEVDASSFDGLADFKALGMSCTKLRKYFAPGISGPPKDWLPSFGTGFELLGLNVQLTHQETRSIGMYFGDCSYLPEAVRHVKDNDPERIHVNIRFWTRTVPHLRYALKFPGPISHLALLGSETFEVAQRHVERFYEAYEIKFSRFQLDQLCVDGSTALMKTIAMLPNSDRRAQGLIAEGASLLGIDSPLYGTQGFLLAATTNRFLYYTLASALEKSNMLEVSLWRAPKLGANALHLSMQFRFADPVSAVLDPILTVGVGINEVDMFGFTALHYAVLHQAKPNIRTLLAKGANPHQHSSSGYRDTPLQSALRNGSSERIVRLLLPFERDIDKFAMEGFQVAGATSWSFLLGLFLSRSDIIDISLSVEVKRGGTVKECAARANQIYPILIAAMRQGPKKLKFLLSHPEISSVFDINASLPMLKEFGFEGGSVLHYAVYRNDLKAINLLLNLGASLGKLDSLGRTPLIIACRFGRSVPCVPHLLRAMAGNVELLNHHETHGQYTALHWTTTWREQHAEVLRQMLQTPGIDLLAKDSHNWTVFDWSIASRHTQFWKCRVGYVFEETKK
jgi:ankyrin repeat protein